MDPASFSVLFAAGIFFAALFSAVIGMVSISFIWTGQRFNKLEAGQAKLEKRMDGIESKLDQLLKNFSN